MPGFQEKRALHLLPAVPVFTNLITGPVDALIDSTLVAYYRAGFCSFVGERMHFRRRMLINITTLVNKWIGQWPKLLNWSRAGKGVLHRRYRQTRTVALLLTSPKCSTRKDARAVPWKCNKSEVTDQPIVRTDYIEQAIALINQAQRPFLIFWPGCAPRSAEKSS